MKHFTRRLRTAVIAGVACVLGLAAITASIAQSPPPPPPPPPSASATTAVPTTAVPTTAVPTTAVPTTAVPTTAVPTTAIPTTAAPDAPHTGSGVASGTGWSSILGGGALLVLASGVLAGWAVRRR